jgi:hypothetical protein
MNSALATASGLDSGLPQVTLCGALMKPVEQDQGPQYGTRVMYAGASFGIFSITVTGPDAFTCEAFHEVRE